MKKLFLIFFFVVNVHASVYFYKSPPPVVGLGLSGGMMSSSSMSSAIPGYFIVNFHNLITNNVVFRLVSDSQSFQCPRGDFTLQLPIGDDFEFYVDGVNFATSDWFSFGVTSDMVGDIMFYRNAGDSMDDGSPGIQVKIDFPFGYIPSYYPYFWRGFIVSLTIGVSMFGYRFLKRGHILNPPEL